MPPIALLKTRTRNDYPFLLDYRTRWADNDMYAHMNNSVYQFLFDSVVNAFLLQNCQHSPQQRGLVVHAHTDYFAPLGFPAVAELGLRVVRLGTSSVRYEIGVFEQGAPAVCAVGELVHVFVDAATGRPNAKMGMHPQLRAGLATILVRRPGDDDGGDEEKSDEKTKSKL